MLIARIAVQLLGELIAPTRCAACDEPVRGRALFCASCFVSVMPAAEQPPGQHALFEYGGAVATAIVRLKYAGRSDLIPRFADVAGASLGSIARSADVVVPVPLHPRRLVQRGFDQAALLAAPIARRLGIDLSPRALERTRETPPQASLDRAARAANVAAAFRCVPSRAGTVSGRRILLVDDVRTTGATLAACIRTLRAAGARDVLTLVVASRGSESG